MGNSLWNHKRGWQPRTYSICHFISILSYRRIYKLNIIRFPQHTGTGDFTFRVKLEFCSGKNVFAGHELHSLRQACHFPQKLPHVFLWVTMGNLCALMDPVQGSPHHRFLLLSPLAFTHWKVDSRSSWTRSLPNSLAPKPWGSWPARCCLLGNKGIASWLHSYTC